MKNTVSIRELVEFANLEVLAGNEGLDHLVKDDEITSPGVELAGFYNYFYADRVVIFGSKEANFLYSMPDDVERERAETLFKKHPCAILFSVNVYIANYFYEFGHLYNVPILRSKLRTTPLTSKIFGYLRHRLADRICVHGVLMDINGMGTLIKGKSGIGKSEIALELIKRGHQIIADDLVEVYEREVGTVVGTAPETIKGFLEVRGVGIINVIETFGVAAYREDKTIRLVIELEEWNEETQYDRLGLVTLNEEYFHTELPMLKIPVKTGRNMAVVIESAAMNEKLKFLGYNSALNLTKRVNELARRSDSDDL